MPIQAQTLPYLYDYEESIEFNFSLNGKGRI